MITIDPEIVVPILATASTEEVPRFAMVIGWSV